MAIFFLVALIAVSGGTLALKVARLRRGEPWVAAQTFKSDIQMLGPRRVPVAERTIERFSATHVADVGAAPAFGPEARGRVRHRGTGTRAWTGSAGRGSPRSADPAFAPSLGAAAMLCMVTLALFGAISWEGPLACGALVGLYVAYRLETRPRPVVRRAGVVPMASYRGPAMTEDSFDLPRAVGGLG